MSKPYMNDFQKLQRVNYQPGPVNTIWTLEDIEKIEAAFEKKGYPVACLSRLDHTATRYDAMIISRADVPNILEYLFTQRIIVEVNVENSYRVALIFVYNNTVDDILKNIRYLRGGRFL